MSTVISVICSSHANAMAAIMEKPAPKDLSYHYSRVTKNRAASKMKQFYQYFFIPGIGNLAGGMFDLSNSTNDS